MAFFFFALEGLVILENDKALIATPSAKKVGHPAPFPVELPYRLLQLYTYGGEVVLDPFMGSGQTALAGLKGGRRYVGYEIDENYVSLAHQRIWSFMTEFGRQTLSSGKNRTMEGQ